MKTLLRAMPVVLLLVLGSPAAAATISLGASKDNTLMETLDGSLSNGIGPHFYSGLTNTFGLRRGLVAFDVSAVPAGAIINSATLSLNVSRLQGSTTISLHRAAADWGQGTSDSGTPGGGGAPSTTGDATWIHTFYNTVSWSAAGGDYVGTLSASAMSAPGVMKFNSPQLVTDVQNWFTSPGTNYGWFVLGNESVFSSAVRFDSRENAAPSVRPQLVVDYVIINTSQWTNPGGGTWSNAANWDNGIPNTAGSRAIFGNAIAGTSTISVLSIHTVGTVTFDHDQRYILAGFSRVRMDNGSITPAAIEVLNGSHTINNTVEFQKSTIINVVPSTSTLTIGGNMSFSAGVTLTKTGAGVAEFRSIRPSNALPIDRLQIDQGTAMIVANGGTVGTSKVTSLGIAGTTGNWAARLDLNDNDLVIDYTGASPLPTVRDQIISGFAGGSFNGNGITTSLGDANHRLGFAEASDIGGGSFSGQTFTGDALLVKYTYPGDADLNGMVNQRDLGRLAINWQSAGDWFDGDFDYSGFVDVLDLVLLGSNWLSGLGAPLGPALDELGLSAVIIVPEPLSLAVFGVFALIGRRRGRV